MKRPSPPSDTVGEQLARRHGWPPEQVAERLFWICLPPWSRLATRVIRVVAPSTFAPDSEAMADACAATSLSEIRTLAQSLARDPRRKSSFIREVLGIRCSGGRLLAFVSDSVTPSGD